MKFTSILRSCAIIVSSVLLAAHATARVEEVNFEDGVVPRSGCWWFEGQNGGTVSVSKDTSLNHAGSLGSLKGTYPKASGDLYVWGGCDIASSNTKEIYVDFWAKMPGAKHGLKFVKVFGQRVGSNYANTTFGLDYTGVDYGSMYSVGYGDGSTSSNDMQSIINFDGTNSCNGDGKLTTLDGRYAEWIGRAFAYKTPYEGRLGALVKTPQNKLWASSNWGTSWHHFKFKVKFNDGTSALDEVPNGEIYVEIDNKVYIDAKGLFNRHYSNKPIQAVSFFDWSQSGSAPFEIWYDNIRISTEGFAGATSTAPNPPSLPTIK